MRLNDLGETVPARYEYRRVMLLEGNAGLTTFAAARCVEHCDYCRSANFCQSPRSISAAGKDAPPGQSCHGLGRG
jgi:hypothetical protein